jgi:hypothetical protein
MKKLEYFTIKPNLKQFYGITVNENTKFDEQIEDGSIKQHFENLTLTTTVEKKLEPNENNPFEVTEESKMAIKMPSGTILIWDEEQGFIISQYQMTNLTNLAKEIEEMKNVYKESKV